MKGALAATLALLLTSSSAVSGGEVPVARFGSGDLSGFEEKVFSGKTEYRPGEVGGRRAVRAESVASASGLFRKLTVDLEKTPWLNWSWRVEEVPAGRDERTKEGDDYPARVYVVFSGGFFFWKTRALNYVWSGSQPVGAVWPNAFTPNAGMIAVESGKGRAGTWVTEKRNVREDFRRLFGEDIRTADAVAVMTDTDNAKGRAVAWYGNIWFSPE